MAKQANQKILVVGNQTVFYLKGAILMPGEEIPHDTFSPAVLESHLANGKVVGKPVDGKPTDEEPKDNGWQSGSSPKKIWR